MCSSLILHSTINNNLLLVASPTAVSGCLRVGKIDSGELVEVERLVEELGRGWGVVREWMRIEGEFNGMRDSKDAALYDKEQCLEEIKGMKKRVEEAIEGREEAMDKMRRIEVKFQSVKKSLKRLEVEKEILKKENQVMEKFAYRGGIGWERGSGGGSFLIERSAMGASIGDLGGSRTPMRGGRETPVEGMSSIKKRVSPSTSILSKRGAGSVGKGVSFEDGLDLEVEVKEVEEEGGEEGGLGVGGSGGLGYSYVSDANKSRESARLIEEMRADNVLLSRALKDFLEDSTAGLGGGEGGEDLNDLSLIGSIMDGEEEE